MSWQAYVDTNLVGSGRVSQAAILGLKGGVWATSPGFNVSPEEQKAIINGFNSPGAVQASGLRIAGEKYITINASEQSINLKKGPDGGVLVKTTQAVLVAVYKAPIQQTEATVVVEGLGDYLRSVNY
ncbi:profilin ii [Moniliophthora roreri MCA 2997]|uniref:Profilin n=2 Tax=Moniliophthora roreri TaxID=221103 RepID=V2X9C7_MONRO|nr:profilin ii [Moniliophthora roreri MCA 2997]KAI3616042.1 profilin ii [Moniliophthora roreri]